MTAKTEGSKKVAKKTDVTPEAIIAAELARTRPDSRGFRNVPIAGTDGAMEVYQAPDGHLGVSWCPKGSNPKYAVRMTAAKCREFQKVLPKYVAVADVVTKLNSGHEKLPKGASLAASEGIKLF